MKHVSKKAIALKSLTPLEVATAMKEWFLENSNEDVGTLSKGSQPHENFFTEFHVIPIDHIFLHSFVYEMLTKQPHKRVLGCQAYRYLRIAVLAHIPVDVSEWPNYAM